MSSENEYKKLLIIGTFVGVLGSIALIFGMISDFIRVGVKILDLGIFAWVIGIFIICLITFLGALIPFGLTLSDERPSLFTLALFILAPTIVISEYTTPMFYLLELTNELVSIGSAGFMSYIGFIGIILLVIAFVILTWMFAWKLKTYSSRENIYQDDFTEIRFVRFMRLFTCISAITAGVFIILGILTPTNSETASLLMSGVDSNLDFSALVFIAFIVTIMLTAILILIGNFGASRIPRNEMPILILLFITIALPGYAPQNAEITTWSSPVFKILEYGKNNFRNILFMGWILIIGVLILILAFMLGIMTYFLKTSATYVSRPTSTGRDRIKSPKAKKVKSSPQQVGTLANQLSIPTGPPTGVQQTIPTGPPSAAQTIPTGPPTSTMAPQTDKPTCPFCGKNLRFINEYQRWYCDSCSQYV